MSQKKIDRFLWLVIALIPLVSYLIQYWNFTAPLPFLEYVNASFSFTWIKDIFDNVLEGAFNVDFPLTGYMSYLVGAELIHCLFDVVVFIPRFAHSVLDKFCKEDAIK